MSEPIHAITYDVGTTGVKTCIFLISEKITPIGAAYAGYNLYMTENGGAEQDPDEWWAAIRSTTKKALKDAGLRGEDIRAVSFCSQMQCLVLADEAGVPVRRAMSYMDGRAGRQYAAGFARGLKISGFNARKLLMWLHRTKAAPTSIKDPIWKYKWVQANEPEVFARVYKWLDAKDYLILRFTGAATMTEGSAYSTFLFDVRPGVRGWSPKLCRELGVDMNHLPRLIKASDRVGTVTARAAAELGLSEDTAVYGGGGDAELIGVGIGAVNVGDTHLYLGTSGWLSTVTDRQIVDPIASIAAIVGCQPDRYHYFAEMETAGKCLEWVKDHLALDEIGVYLEKKNVTESLERVHLSLYDYLCEVIETVPAGSCGVLFAPWLHGNRCPFEDANARGMFFNIGLDTGKSVLIRAVVEGIGYHCRMMLEAHEKKLKTSETIMICGGGASSPVICRTMADILGHNIATLPDPQNVGAFGAAMLIATATGAIPSLENARDLLPEYTVYTPNPAHKAVHRRNYDVFKRLHGANKKGFARLNT
ncbi:MAG: FGGY-family carbohydrate kinase [Clostridiales Family XIII bacterium]|jgi:xylulokinase|nr:FGGY-family carbohydrate kinase [Clostridiales Family XIII bacterium]